mmetsp:Transcript_3208/g.9640  ORF Transcript_3208/g.9640 Transcript_3208/m.9640 type:complete len:240 (+) Transcript_3208:345-1064(+)
MREEARVGDGAPTTQPDAPRRHPPDARHLWRRHLGVREGPAVAGGPSAPRPNEDCARAAQHDRLLRRHLRVRQGRRVGAGRQATAAHAHQSGSAERVLLQRRHLRVRARRRMEAGPRPPSTHAFRPRPRRPPALAQSVACTPAQRRVVQQRHLGLRGAALVTCVTPITTGTSAVRRQRCEPLCNRWSRVSVNGIGARRRLPTPLTSWRNPMAARRPLGGGTAAARADGARRRAARRRKL